MSADNRLTADQLAALAPGDVVSIESGGELGRRRYTTGTVVRVDPSHIVVSCRGGTRGGTFIECYGRRDGIRVGGLTRAELISSPEPSQTEARRRTQHIDLLFREWSRNRSDVDRLRRLHAAIGECLEALTGAGSR